MLFSLFSTSFNFRLLSGKKNLGKKFFQRVIKMFSKEFICHKRNDKNLQMKQHIQVLNKNYILVQTSSIDL